MEFRFECLYVFLANKRSRKSTDPGKNFSIWTPDWLICSINVEEIHMLDLCKFYGNNKVQFIENMILEWIFHV